MDFTQLHAWQKATDLAVCIHEVTKKFPKEELYGLISQLRRSSASVAANIAEGFGRYTYPDKRAKYTMARGELIEVMSFLYYCERIGYLQAKERDELITLCTEVHKLINGLVTCMNDGVKRKVQMP